MIASFFQSLEREGVSYLLISGQATVLYGAAAFSEDIDLWIKPTAENAHALLKALQSQGARYHKLTPPLNPTYLLGGHGFHFRVPDDTEFYLDVMGRPPRVPSFNEAMADANVMDTSWGRLPTVGIRALVAVKMTQRLGDYPVIGQLVLRYLEQQRRVRQKDCVWALEHVYTIEDMKDLAARFPLVADSCDKASPLKEFLDDLRKGDERTETRLVAEAWLTERMMKARERDRAYWMPIIAELRGLRNEGKLMPVGRLVKAGGETRLTDGDCST
jgi:hypothetical protein